MIPRLSLSRFSSAARHGDVAGHAAGGASRRGSAFINYGLDCEAAGRAGLAVSMADAAPFPCISLSRESEAPVYVIGQRARARDR